MIDPFLQRTRIAYFSMEIALRAEMHTYSGGLGVLAGDTARSAADLGLPMVFVTLISHKGYLAQNFDAAGRQVESADPWEAAQWLSPLGAMIAVPVAGREVWIRPWLFVLGASSGCSVPILFLDTNLEQNHPDDRGLTDYLYGGDQEYRFKQNIILGMGGAMVLRALGFSIDTYHMNEGHSALLAAQLLHDWRRPPAAGIPTYDIERVRRACVFTTHTPVGATSEVFPYGIVQRLLGADADIDELRRLGGTEGLNLTLLALNLSGYVNGVAHRHATTTDALFPGHHVHAITNGIHPATWTHAAFARLYSAVLKNWEHEPEILSHAEQLADEDVWQAHRAAKADLARLVKQHSGVELQMDVPVIGFARRMTGYKRPDLLFHDIGQLTEIARARPFQIVLAGKAHPRDEEGKRLVEMLNTHVRELKDRVNIAFLPSYDLAIAGCLVAGCDIWLNTPLPPLEASGTSGMKAAFNGVLNVSVLDGWWLEAWIEGVTGWSVGNDGEFQHEQDAANLYDKLRGTILPLYYDDRAKWIWMMKQGISKIASYFNSQRMMRRYASEAYLR